MDAQTQSKYDIANLSFHRLLAKENYPEALRAVEFLIDNHPSPWGLNELKKERARVLALALEQERLREPGIAGKFRRWKLRLHFKSFHQTQNA